MTTEKTAPRALGRTVNQRGVKADLERYRQLALQWGASAAVIIPASEVVDGVVFRQPKAYPVYDRGYRQHLQVIQRFLATVDNLQTIGRSGMHRYNNMDHSMLTGMLAARNILGESYDLWGVNTDSSYGEETAEG